VEKLAWVLVRWRSSRFKFSSALVVRRDFLGRDVLLPQAPIQADPPEVFAVRLGRLGVAGSRFLSSQGDMATCP
jgi:hypothetical protein